MTEPTDKRTHVAYAYRREGKKFGRMLEIGAGWIDKERGIAHLVLDRLPLGSFTGYVMLTPKGTEPAVPDPQPQRPGEDGEG